MENASKALLMAAGVLMGVAVLTLAVYLYTSFSGSAQSIKKDIEQGQLEQFNNQFIEFSSKECTISDILTCINLANDYNKKNELKELKGNEKYYIAVYVSNSSKTLINNVDNTTILKNILKSKKTEKTDYTEITDDELKLYKFTCTIGYSDETGRVNRINFTKKK